MLFCAGLGAGLDVLVVSFQCRTFCNSTEMWAAQAPSGLFGVCLPTGGHNSHNSHVPYHSFIPLWAALTRVDQAQNIFCHRLSLNQNPALEPSEFP